MKRKVKFGRATFVKRTVKCPTLVGGGIVEISDEFHFDYHRQEVRVRRITFRWAHDKTQSVFWTPCEGHVFYGSLSQALSMALFYIQFDEYTENRGR